MDLFARIDGKFVYLNDLYVQHMSEGSVETYTPVVFVPEPNAETNSTLQGKITH